MSESKLYAGLNKIGQFWAWLIFTGLILGISILTSFQPVWANIPFNIIIPILVLIFLKTVFFEKLKLSTLIVMRTLILFAVFGVFAGSIYVKIVLVFLVINILEATFTDLKKKKYFNFVTGILLALSTIPVFWFSSVWVTAGSSAAIWAGPYYYADTVAISGTICWIVAYTIWNWLFVTNEFTPSIAYLHVGILLAPIAGSVIFMHPGLWLIFRANSLTIGGVFQISNKDFLEKKLENNKMARFIDFVGTTKVQVVLMLVNSILIAIPVVMTVRAFV